MDWQEVGRRPEVTFEWPDESAPPAVQVFDRDALVQWFESDRKGPRPEPVVEMGSHRAPTGLCRARCEVDLPEGRFILGLRDSVPWVLSGIRVAKTPWTEFHTKMLAARAGLAKLRRNLPRGTADEPFFTISTTVFDTAPEFLDDLFQCLRTQEYGDYEWLVLDNGSKRPDVMQKLRDFAAADRRVRLYRVEENIHIIPGNRYLLARARGRYLVPVDSDDFVYSDALALLAEQLAGESPPEVLFSEESRVAQDGQAIDYLWRPSFSRLYSLATCPAAHLMAFCRRRAQEVGAYSDDYAQGSHDWDTCMRMVTAGARVVRIPHVLYGWRMHAGSSAMSSSAKDYLHSSQVGVLRHTLQRLELADRFTVESTELGGIGYYHLQRQPTAPQPLAVDFVLRTGTESELSNLVHNLRHLDYPTVSVRVVLTGVAANERTRDVVQRRLRMQPDTPVALADPGTVGDAVSTVAEGVFAKAIVDCSLRLKRADWLWDALGTFELDPATGVVGGRVLDSHGFVQHIGYFAGLDGFVATPNHGGPQHSVCGHLAHVRRSVTAVYGGLLIVRSSTFAKVGPLLDVDCGDALSGIEFCMRSARHGVLTAYTPRVDAVRDDPLPKCPGAGDPFRDLLLSTYPSLRAADPYYSALLSGNSATFGMRVEGFVPPPAVAPAEPRLIQRLVRNAAAVAGSTTNSARRVILRTVDRVLNRPVRTPRGFQVPAPTPPPPSPELPPRPPTSTTHYLPATGLLTPADPLHFRVDPSRKVPTLNVLLPGVCMRGMSGGPNTIYNLTYRMAEQGVPVRYVSTGTDMDADLKPILAHIQSLAEIPRKLANVSFVDAHDRSKEVPLGADDVFLATAWWTAQMVKYALPLVRSKRFLYVIQDFEAVLHEHGTLHALALETYGLDYVPFVNHRFLAEYLARQKVGRFADPAFAARSVVIDPALDRTRFFPQLDQRPDKRRLLFYARPRSAKRNLFELGIAALQRAVQQGAFANEPWEFLAMGDPVAPVELGQGHVLQPAPWRDFDGYAAQMREADVLLSLMLSPHPSYPPLEMAACGGLVVTNSFANKTQAEFAGISKNILAPAATIEAISDALGEASHRVADLAARKANAALASPSSWTESFAHVVPRAIAAFHECRGGR